MRQNQIDISVTHSGNILCIKESMETCNRLEAANVLSANNEPEINNYTV